VEGRLKYDEWEKDGQKQSRLSVVGERVQFLGAPRGASFQDSGSGAESAPAPSARQEQQHVAPPPPEMEQGPEEDEDDLPF